MGWKDVEFSGSDSAERVRGLQALCSASPDHGAFDGLLVIGGVDSFHSRLSQAVIKYLFVGSSGQELLGEQVLSQDNDRLEDVVLLLTRRRISIFYSSESDAAVKILPMVAQWRHVTECTIHDAMDPDEQEMRKIAAFKQMVDGVKRIGIPYGLDKHGCDLADPMVPEKWPLVQSFGLENSASGSGGKGFFTMHHTVVNVTTVLQAELARLDDFGAKRVATEVPPMLAHHFNQFLTKLDHAETPAVRGDKSESEMGEDLISLYEFGTTQHEARGLATTDSRGSRVLFGKRTALAATAKASATALLASSGGDASAATHMLVQTEDPFSGVRFTRTYFLATGRTAPRVVDEDALVRDELAELSAKQSEDRDTSANTRVLVELYVLLLRGFRCAVQAFAQQASGRNSQDPETTLAQCLAAAKQEALDEIRHGLRAQLPGSALLESNLPTDFVATSLAIHANAMDACGRDTQVLGQKWSLLYLSLSFQDVPSQFTPRDSLGSLVVGDTILLQSSTAPFLNTTASFPYFRSWIQANREFDSVKAQLAVLQSGFMLQSPALRLGSAMVPLDAALDEGGASSGVAADAASSFAPSKATPALSSVGLSRAVLLLESEEYPQLNGSMQLFSGGFCFKTPNVIPILVSFAHHALSFRIVSTPYEELVLLQIELKPDDDGHTAISRSLPFAVTSRVVAFPLLAGTRFQEEVVHALSVWKQTAEALSIPFYRPHDLVQFDGMTPRDERSADGELSPLMAKSCASLARKSSTYAHNSTNAVIDKLFPRWFIPKDSNLTTTLPKPRKTDREKTVVPITIVLGLPGSSAASIAATICDVSSAAYDWDRVDIDCRDMDRSTFKSQTHDEYASAQIQRRVAAALQRIVGSSSSELPPRLLLCVVGYVDCVAVARAIKRPTGSSWAMPTKIASLVGCVSATNVYLPDPNGAQCPLPRLFDQLMAGFATHVVVTHTSDVPGSALGRLRYRIDQTNPFADIHVLSSDVFEGSLTSLLSVDRFESAYYKNYRQAQSPHWEEEELAGDVDPATAPECVRFEIAPGVEKTRFLLPLGKTLTPFAVVTKSIDKIHPVDQQLMARQPLKGGGGRAAGIRLAQSLAAEKVLAHPPQQQQDVQGTYGDCWSVEALLTFAGDLDTVYEYVSTGAYARMRVVKQAHQHQAASFEIKITGRKLVPDKIHDLILGCYVKMDGAVQPMKSKLTLSLEEKRAIQKLHVMDELPEGFYYDGLTYIDQLGGRHEFHPRMDEFIEDHLRQLNDQTKQHNAQIEENRKSQQAYVKQLV